MKSKLLNIVSYGLVGVGLGSAAFGSMPFLQELVPQFTTQLALLTGIPASTMGAIGLSVSSYINTARKTDLTMNEGVVGGLDKVFNKIDEIFIKQDKVIDNLSSKYNGLEKKYDEMKSGYTKMEKRVDRVIQLLETDLESKLSNPLIDSEVKKTIEGVLHEV